MLEFYAGFGNLSRVMKASGLRAGKFDLKYHVPHRRKKHMSNPMDILTPSGFLFLGLLEKMFCFFSCVQVGIPKVYSIQCFVFFNIVKCWLVGVWINHIRLCLACILKCRKVGGFLAFFAIKCASWTAINAGASNRAPCASVGFDDAYQSVSQSNAMLERTLVCLVYH